MMNKPLPQRRYGEIFTPLHVVDRMLAIPSIWKKTQDVSATFFEPCAGQGIFLAAILDAKLKYVTDTYKDPDEWSVHALTALASIYGMELLEHNKRLACDRMQFLFEKYCEQVLGNTLDGWNYRDVAQFVIRINIRCGDSLARQVLDCRSMLFPRWEFTWFQGAPYVVTLHPMQKFDVVITNPPYHGERSGASTHDPPIYHLFMDTAYQIADQACFITPARWLFNAGSTPKQWNRKMLDDPHLQVVEYEPDASKLFPKTEISGGVCITLRDTRTEFGAIGMYIVYPELRSILQKVLDTRPQSLSNIIAAQGSYHYAKVPELGELSGRCIGTNAFRRDAELFSDDPKDGYCRVLGLQKGKRTFKWIERHFVEDHETVDKHKVLVAKANGASGVLGDKPARLISRPVVVGPGTVATTTFLAFGCFDTKQEAENLCKYLHTKFCRAILGILKVTPHNASEKWKYVPLQNFSCGPSIRWDEAVCEVDQQLYRKYGLDQRETEFIESHVEYLTR